MERITQCLACNSKEAQAYVKTKTMMSQEDNEWQFCQCSNCGLVYLRDRVEPQNLGAYYTDAYLPYRGPKAWGKFAGLVAGDLAKIDKKRAKTVAKYALSKQGSVLDIGCGNPSFLAQLAAKTQFQCEGIDFSDEGWKDGQYEGLNLKVLDPKDYTSTSPIDIFTMWHYLEHDYDPQVTLKNLLNSAHEESRLIIEVPNHDSYSRRRYNEFWSAYHTPRHTALYTIPTMKTLLENSGWKLIDAYEYGTLDPYTLDWMSRMEKKNIDWSKNMEEEFIPFVWGKMIRPYYFAHKWKSLGFLTAIAKPINL